jgi:hypothetical protein
LFSTAHLLRNRLRYRYGAPFLNWLCYRPATLLPYLLTRLRPVALRPALSRGLPFSEVKTFLLLHRRLLFSFLTFYPKIYSGWESNPYARVAAAGIGISGSSLSQTSGEDFAPRTLICVRVNRSEVACRGVLVKCRRRDSLIVGTDYGPPTTPTISKRSKHSRAAARSVHHLRKRSWLTIRKSSTGCDKNQWRWQTLHEKAT